tara:strand:- start:2512 stop:2748 length:237 start_codon:yes stop_codon:yes gene_type:complete
MNNLDSDQIVYSEHGDDECFEYTNGKGRVPDGVAIGYEVSSNAPNRILILFNDITYSKYDHRYWDNLELENDPSRVII